MDNWFSGYPLFRELKHRGFNATGTYRANRKCFPRELVEQAKKLDRGDSVSYQSDLMVAGAWCDKKPVFVCSTEYSYDVKENKTVQRTQHDGKEEELKCTPAHVAYQTFMGGTDRFDQLRSLYACGARRHYKWWHALFFYFIDALVTNVTIAWQCLHPKLDKLHVVLDLVKALVSQNESKRKRRRKQGGVTRGSSHAEHMPVYLGKQGRCVECGTRSPRSGYPRSGCMKCKVHLCLPNSKGNCFLAYHERTLHKKFTADDPAEEADDENSEDEDGH